MPKLRNRQPKLCFYAAEGYIVFCAGRRIRLGRDKAAAEEQYRQVIAELNQQPTLPIRGAVTMAELYAAWFAENPPSQPQYRYVTGARSVLALYASTPVHEFGPLAFKAVRGAIFDRGSQRDSARGEPLSRQYVNSVMSRVKTVVSWGVANELVPPHVVAALREVRGLPASKTPRGVTWTETAPVEPVDDAVVDATLPFLPPVVADMVQVQRLTGARPSEVCTMTAAEIDRTDDVWLYLPAEHKNAHRGKPRTIFIGPQAQAILAPYIADTADDDTAPLFSPRRSAAMLASAKRAARKTAVQPSQADRRKSAPRKTPGVSYTRDSYRQAIMRAAKKAGVPHWFPYQLRHTAATKIRHEHGLEAAQVALGHAKADVTQIYAERDARLGAEIARKMG